MELLNANNPTVKIKTVDVQALLRAHINDNGRARNGGNGRRRRPRRQIRRGYRRARLQADTAVLLVEGGMGVTEAIERCGTTTGYFYALKALRESGHAELRKAVLEGDSPITSAKQVENAAAAIAALRQCSVLEQELVRLATGATNDPIKMLLNLSPDQLVATSNTLGLDWVWDRMIAAAMLSAEPAPSEDVALNVA